MASFPKDAKEIKNEMLQLEIPRVVSLYDLFEMKNH